MNPLYTNEEFNNTKYNDMLPLKCKNCGKTFYKIKTYIKTFLNNKTHTKFDFCSIQCSKKYQKKLNTIYTKCDQCGTDVIRSIWEFTKNKHHFCSLSCSASYHNTHKTYGSTRSKLEKWIEIQLTSKYPNIEFHFNRKDTIGSELDIYIPSLKLAFELNGIFHYEPIFGKEHLGKTQNNDKRKYQSCLEHKIDMCIIDVSQQKNFKEHNSLKFLDIICNIIDNRIIL